MKPRAEIKAQILANERDDWVAKHMAHPTPGTMTPADCIRREYLDLVQQNQATRSKQFPSNAADKTAAAEEGKRAEKVEDTTRPTIEKREMREEAYSFDTNPTPAAPADPIMHKEFQQLSDTLSFLRATRDPPGTNPEHTVEGTINAALQDLRPRSSAIPRPEGPKQPTPEEVDASWREEARRKYPLADAAEVHPHTETLHICVEVYVYVYVYVCLPAVCVPILKS